MSGWRELVETRIARVHEPERDKRMPLGVAIRRFVRPGAKINPGNLQPMSTAVNAELCRAFAGTDPGFEFVSSSLAGNYLPLVHLGLLRKAIVSFAGEGYPTPGPSPIVARALARGQLELESWSMLTLIQRLAASAFGVPFWPTRSLKGSSIGEELAQAGLFAEIEDPFAPQVPGRLDERQGVVRAYQPDVSMLHAWAADAHGNALLFPPHQDNVYGALAARDGVIVTAHRIVSGEFVRRHAHLVRVPGEIVLAVCEAPYGSHPYGNYVRDVPELESYANDYPFMREHRAAQEDEAAYDAWVHEWILDLPDHEAYLEKIGSERIERLHFLARPESWLSELERLAPGIDAAPEQAGPVEEMIVQGAREVAKRIRAHGYRTVLSGVGQATLIAWLAAHALRDEGLEFAMMAETGMYGHDPRPGDPFLLNYWNLPTTTLLTDIFETLGIHGCGGRNACLATIGAGQLDRFGNVNSTRGSDGRFLVGSGGANDITSAAQETVVVAAQRKQSFVERVDYVTSPGARVRCVLSTLGRFEKRGEGEDIELMLTGWYARPGLDADAAVEAIRGHCGWQLAVSRDLEALAPATQDELALLRVFDPERFFLGKARPR